MQQAELLHEVRVDVLHLIQERPQLLAQALVRQRRARHAHDVHVVRQVAVGEEVEQRGEGFLLCEVP